MATTDAAAPAAKKRRTATIPAIFNAATFAGHARYAKEHGAGKPYPHVRVEDLFDQASLRAIVQEAKEHLTTTFKETDLFKMFQTLDLANFKECDDEEIMELRAKVPTIVKLRDALYSPEFRTFVHDTCGVDMELTERVDMAMQAYSAGGHLLCHDDVIGTRAVSFIIYLTDPDINWTTGMGGNLELYDSDKATCLPHKVPTQIVPPTANSMCMFKVQPGVTFHAVSEVLTDETPRLSLQGWFHAAKPPPGAEEASSLSTLKDLKTDPTVFDALPASVPEGGVTELSAEDVAFLSAYVNAEYLKPESVEKIRQKFAQDGVVQLRDFLLKDVAGRVAAECSRLDAEDKVGDGRGVAVEQGASRPGHHLQGSPVTQRYIKLEGSGMALEDVQQKVMKSAAMVRLVAWLTTLRPLGYLSECRRFRAGADYTVAYHKLLEPDTRLDATLSFVEPSQGWATGDIGGFECYIAAESSDLVAAEAYGTDEDASNDLVSLHACNNSLALVARDEHMMRFVKYVAAAAPGSRWDVSTTYEIECHDDEEEEEEEGGEAEA